MMRQRVGRIIDEIRPKAVTVNGLEGVLRKLAVYINDNDYEKIKCVLTNNGHIAAWDELLDVLKTCDVQAFETYVSLTVSYGSKVPKDVQDTLKKACRRHNLEKFCREQRDCDDMGWRWEDSTDSSFDSIDQDDGLVKAKRERFASSGSACSEGRSKSTTSTESYEQRPLSIGSCISHLPQKLRRELGYLLDPDDTLDKDWRRLAEELLLEHNDIKRIEEESGRTAAVLDVMQQRLMTVGQLVEKLRKIERLDCVQLIEYAVVDLSPELAEPLDGMRNDGNNINGKSKELHSLGALQETTAASESEVFKSHPIATDGKVQVNQDKYVDIYSHKDMQRIEAASQRRIANNVRSAQETEGMINSFGMATIESIGTKRYQRSKSMPEKGDGDSISHCLNQKTKAASFDKEKNIYTSHTIGEKDSNTESRHAVGLPSPSAPFLDGGVVLQEIEESEEVTGSKLGSDEFKPETFKAPICLKKEDPAHNRDLDPMVTFQSMALPKQDSDESLPPTKEVPTKYTQVTLPIMRPISRTCIQTLCNTKEVQVLPKIAINPMKDTQGGNMVQASGNSSPPTPCSPKTEKAWMESENFRKPLDLPFNSSPPSSTTNEFFCGSQKTLNDEQGCEFSNSGIVISETKVAFKEDEKLAYSSKGLKPHMNIGHPVLSAQPQYSESSIRSPHQEQNKLSLENKTSSWISLTLTSMVSSLFEKMGLDRRPAVPHRAERASECSPIVVTRPRDMLRQVSTNNAVPSEHSEYHVKRPGGNDHQTMKEKSPCVPPHSHFEAISETKKTDGSRRSSKHLMREGRFALLINNCNYADLPELPSENFTDSLGRELKQCGWHVEIQPNLSKQNMKNAIEGFADRSKDGIAFFYYFGHSIRIHGENYILPVNIESQAVKTKAHLKKYAINLKFIRSKLSTAEASALLLDAGRVLCGFSEMQGFAAVQEKPYQCVLFTTSSFSNERFIANRLGRRLRDSEAIRSMKEWIAPFKNDFEVFAVSRRLLPLPIKVPDGEWNRKLLDCSNNKMKRMAFFSKANGDLQTGQLDGKWLVNFNTDSNDLESDFNIFLKTADNENLACYLFYYEGAVEMDNGELLLKQTTRRNLKEPPTLAMILEMLAETVIGPRVIIVNATESNFDISDFSADEYYLQETLFMISASYDKRKQNFYNDLIVGLKEENGDVELELLKLCDDFDFKLFKCSLFNV